MPGRICDRCGEPIPEGRAAYLVGITLVADFDGRLPVSVSPAEQAALWQELESGSQAELEKEVYERQSYVLCRVCRRRWAADPLGRGQPSESPGRVH